MGVKIFGADKSEYKNNYVFKKEQEFIQGFRQFLLDIGFKQFDIITSHFGYVMDKDGNPIISEDIDIQEYEDEQFFFQNEEYKIDLVFGKDKIFLIIYTKEDKQQEISEKLHKFSTM